MTALHANHFGLASLEADLRPKQPRPLEDPALDTLVTEGAFGIAVAGANHAPRAAANAAGPDAAPY